MRNITEKRNAAIATDYKRGISEEDLAETHDVGLTYIRTILRQNGLIEKRPRKDLSERDLKVRAEHIAGKSIDQLAIQTGLTPTRIRQIVHDEAGQHRQQVLTDAKEKAVALIKAGKNHKEVIEIIGEQNAKRLKYRFNFNIFKLIVQQRSQNALTLYNKGVPPAQIATKLKCTRDYVYMLLRDGGVKLKLTKEEKQTRDIEIFNYLKSGGSAADAAEKWALGETMIKIIYEKQKRAHANKKSSKAK